MITFIRIKTNVRDGWSVNIPPGQTLHDCALAGLVKYTAALGYLKPGDKYEVVNDIDVVPKTIRTYSV